jgi:hypothetical protein
MSQSLLREWELRGGLAGFESVVVERTGERASARALALVESSSLEEHGAGPVKASHLAWERYQMTIERVWMACRSEGVFCQVTLSEVHSLLLPAEH